MLYKGIFFSLFIAFALLFQQLSVGKQNISCMFELSVFNYTNSWIFLNPTPQKKPDWCCIELTERLSGLYWSPFWLLQSKKLSQIGIQLPLTDITKVARFIYNLQLAYYFVKYAVAFLAVLGFKFFYLEFSYPNNSSNSPRFLASDSKVLFPFYNSLPERFSIAFVYR